MGRMNSPRLPAEPFYDETPTTLEEKKIYILEKFDSGTEIEKFDFVKHIIEELLDEKWINYFYEEGDDMMASDEERKAWIK